MSEGGVIPFVRPVRVGNFKLWRSRFQMSVNVEDNGVRRKEKVDVECLNVSDVEGTWKVQVPSTFEMFSVLSALYQDYSSDDERLRSKSAGLFSILLGNMMYATTIGNGYYHRALEIVATCYAYPMILDKKDKRNKDLRKDVDSLVSAFVTWRKLWDKTVEEGRDEEKEDLHDEFAEKAEEILKQEEDIVEDEDK